MGKSNYTIPQMYVTIVNKMINASYSINDFVTMKHDGNYSNDVFSFGDKFILKIYFDDKKFETEKKTVEKLSGCDFLADDYLFDNENKIMICSLIKGKNLYEYVRSKNELPSDFLDAYFDIRIQMLEKGVDDWDYKLDSIIWTEEGSVKKFDFDVVLFRYPPIANQLQSLQEEKEKLKRNDSAAWDNFINKPSFMEVGRSIFDNYRKTL